MEPNDRCWWCRKVLIVVRRPKFFCGKRCCRRWRAAGSPGVTSWGAAQAVLAFFLAISLMTPSG